MRRDVLSNFFHLDVYTVGSALYICTQSVLSALLNLQYGLQELHKSRESMRQTVEALGWLLMFNINWVYWQNEVMLQQCSVHS